MFTAVAPPVIFGGINEHQNGLPYRQIFNNPRGDFYQQPPNHRPIPAEFAAVPAPAPPRPATRVVAPRRRRRQVVPQP